MEILAKYDLLSLGVAIIIFSILGCVVLLNEKKSITNRTFFVFSVVAILYSIFNYLSYQFNNAIVVLWLLRLVLFFSVWYSFALFQLALVFPEKYASFPIWYKRVLIPLVIFVSLVTLSPYAFSRIDELAPTGQVSNPVRGPGMIAFGMVVVSLVIAAAGVLGKKMFVKGSLERSRNGLVLLGTLLTYSMIIVFNFIFPVIYNDLRFIPWAPVFTFPFIMLTAYASIKYHLFNVKVIATQLLTFAIWIFLLVRALLSTTFEEQAINGGLFVLTLVLGILLIRSVLREVEQREKLEKVTKELELANVELKRLDESKSEFISIASHQLRTPLTIIKGFISMINEGSFGRVPPKIREQLVKVFTSNERLISLVEDMLNLSRIESGRQEYKWQETDLTALVGSVAESLTKNAEAKGLKLKFIAPKAKMPGVVCDSDKLHEVLMNFVDNAIKYTPAGSVTVSLDAKPAGMVTVAVKDTGMGIAPQNLGYLFQKFSRVKGSFLVQPGGSGLGLYVAKKIVDVHEGKIWAESPGEGKGTTFAFSLPIAGPKVRPQAKAKLPTPLGQVPAGAGPATPPVPSAASGIVK